MLINLGRYKILRKIGDGGMAEVFLAYDSYLHHHLAIKVYSPIRQSGPESAEFIARFMQEAQALAKINHPNVVRIFDVSPTGDQPYFCMEYIEGTTLRTYLHKKINLSYKEKVNICLGICRAIIEVHKVELIHRDLKLDNIMVTKSHEIKLIDFGITKDYCPDKDLSNPNLMIGSPANMSPEQIDNHLLDYRSDIFAFGIVMYEIFTNVNPFMGKTLNETLDHIKFLPVMNPQHLNYEINDNLAKIIIKCLEKDPKARFQSMQEIQRLLEKAADSGFWDNFKKMSRKYSMPILFLPALAFAIFSFSLYWWQGESKKNELNALKYYKEISSCDRNDEQQCQKMIIKNLNLISLNHWSVKCGDGFCSFLEVTCNLCASDCKGSSSNIFSKPACYSLFFPVNKNQSNFKMRMYYNHCLFNANSNPNLNPPKFAKKMAQCLLESNHAPIHHCKDIHLRSVDIVHPHNSMREIAAFFECILIN